MLKKHQQKGIGTVRLWTRFLAALLGLACAAGALTPCVLADADTAPTVEAGRTGSVIRDTYILAVSTGVCAGTSVLYFGVRYQDANGMERTEFILPHDGSLQRGYAEAEKAGNQSASDTTAQRIKKVESVTGYTAAVLSSEKDGLASYSYDTYMFQMPFGLTEIIDVEIFMRHGKVGTVTNANGSHTTQKNEWTCNGVCIYRMDTLYGLGMAGYWSANRYIDFDGTLVAEMTIDGDSCVDFSIAQTDRLFSLGNDKGLAYGLVCYKEQETKTYSVYDNISSVLLRMDIADVSGAGIEALANEYRDKKAPIESMNLCEALTVEFEYRDIFGFRRTVYIPFITSAVTWMTEQVDGLEKDSVIGIAQQGDTLLFEASFPDYAEMVGFTLHYGPDAASDADIVATNSDRRVERLDKLVGDTLSYTSFGIYDAEKTNASVMLEGAILTCDVNGTPLQVYTASSASGQTIKTGELRNIGSSFLDAETDDDGSTTLIPTVSDDMYIVEIVTDYPENASTTSDIKATFTYVSQSGKEKSPEAVDVRSAASDFIGYWPSASLGDVSYIAGASSGGKLVFVLNYTDVQYFKSVELYLEGDDDWQMASISIYRVSYLSGRKATWLSEDRKVGTTLTDRNIYREYSTDNCEEKYKEKLLLSSKQNRVLITFDGSGGTAEEQGVDWEKLQYSMTYNETMQNLGFTKALKTYTIAVQVKSNSNASEVYGDCGSVNQFYFQLIFEKGQSAYVQANQQLSADGFRAGKEETFTISVNRDYGDLRAVRILPDDVLDEENMYDKLNIDTITVSENSSVGFCRSWRIRSVGWVDIDFKDNGKNSSDTSIKLRTEYQMTKSYQFTDKGYTANLLFVLGIGEYSKNVLYEGTLSAEIYYRDSNNQPKSTNIDIAKAIAEYAERDPKYAAATAVDGDEEKRGLIDSSYMLQPGSVNRFFVKLTDVTGIESIRLQFGATVCTSFTITSLDVYEITSDGSLLINANNEYQWSNTVEHITGAMAKNPMTVEIISDAYGNPQYIEIPVDMEANTISINQKSWETEIQREPLGDDDTLNIYLYTKDGEKVNENIVVSGTIQYQMRTSDRTYQAKIKKFDLSPERNMLYVLGVNAKSLSALRQISLKADDTAHIDHAVVQQVRYGVVIGTYYFDFTGLNAEFNISAKPTAIAEIQRDKQVIRLNFTSDTETVKLIANEVDLAVMFSYSTYNDVNETLYDSAYIYLTDQQIQSIQANGYAEITFENSYIKNVRSVSVIGIGEYNATLSSVEVRTYSTDSVGHESCTGVWQSVASAPITRSKKTVDCTKTDATAVEITFTGSPVITGQETTPDWIGLEIIVVTENGQNASVTVNDASKYLISGSFAPGETAKVRLLIDNVSEIRGVLVEPHSKTEGTAATWSLGSISVHITGAYTDETNGCAVNSVLTEGTPFKYNPNGLHIQTNPTITKPDGTSSSLFEPLYEGESVELTVSAGSTVSFPVAIVNGIPGYATYSVALTCQNAPDDFDPATVFAEENHVYVLNPGVPTEQTVYTVTVTSDENPSYSITVTVKVLPE